MATTSTQLVAWLKKGNNKRVVLVEAGVSSGGSEITRYISDKGFVTGASEVPANTLYIPAISGGVTFTESLSLEGEVNISYGSIEFNNVNGEIDGWLNDVWKNRPIRVFIGDASWPRTDFYKIFDGITEKIDCNARDKITLTISDKLQRLNTTVTDVKLGGLTANADKLIPWLFGEQFNITPLLTDVGLNEYQISGGPIENIIEVRDNGVPVSFTPYLTTGKFRLNQSPVGTITCSAQGDKPSTYVNDVVGLIKRLVKDFGNAASRFVDADLDLTSLSTFAAANTQPVGLYLTEKANLLECCNRLASSIGARVAMTRDGLMYLVKISLPQASAGTTVTAADMAERSLHVSEMCEVQASIQVGYCKNNTIQNALQTGLTQDQIAMYAQEQEWLTVTSVAPTVATKYKLFTNPNMIETQLLDTTSATNEANRLRDMWSVQRKVVEYQGLPWLMTETLGSPHTIQHKRFDLAAGVRGQIVSITANWLKATIDIGVLI